jgi:hypothetical protein
MYVQFVTLYLFIWLISHNCVPKQKLQIIHHKTLRKAGLSYEVVKVGRLCGTSSQRHNLNNMSCAIFFFHLAAVSQVELTRKIYLPPSGTSCRLQEFVINYVNCAKLQ